MVVFQRFEGKPTTLILFNSEIWRKNYYLAGPLQGLKIQGGHVILGGDNVPPPLFEIGLIDLPKSGEGAIAPPAPLHLRP